MTQNTLTSPCSFRSSLLLYLALTSIATSLLISQHATAAPEQGYKITKSAERIKVDHKLFKLYFVMRTAEQMAAFYYARGFSEAMVQATKKVCFITVGMGNKSKNKIWLDIREWKFDDATGPLIRYDRAYWFALWKKMKSPLRFQSTFRWTLIPTILDYQAGEREGGNITLQRRNKPFRITAMVRPDNDKNSTPIKVIINNVKCLDSKTNKRSKK
ncbi:hypothetical protein MNBD_GAMMA12-319 [hydrothermal vent metagenome]|uniref:Uncharacterized protein n=1 Tax=hydrothermal vent metagenome TaxID=652676 RepID=A0A3B0XRI5_9ZZZZ